MTQLTVQWWRDDRLSVFRPTDEETARHTARMLAGLPGTQQVWLDPRDGTGTELIYCAHVTEWLLRFTPGVGTEHSMGFDSAGDLRDEILGLEEANREGCVYRWSWTTSCRRCGNVLDESA